MNKPHKLLLLGLVLILTYFSLNSTEAIRACETDGYGYVTCDVLFDFPDVENYIYREAIEYVQSQKIVQGYPDGTYQPANPINRAEFTKILLEAKLDFTPSGYEENCFPDVPNEEWFADYVCYAKVHEIIKGYPDGYFRPANHINFAESAKIIAETFDLGVEDLIEGEEWFIPYIKSLSKKNAIPTTIQKIDHLTTRGEMAELIQRIKEIIRTRPSLESCDLVPSLCSADLFSGYSDDFLLSEYKVDMSQVRQRWLEWYNGARNAEGLHDYTYNNQLNRTAYIWSDFSKDRGHISHKRIGQTEYYDYNMIAAWFANLGLTFENVYRVTFTENIGGGYFNCSKEDCTNHLIENIRSTFDFYMGEKNDEYRPHYNSVMNGYFYEIGLGIAIDKSSNKYYLTVHYGTEIL